VSEGWAGWKEEGREGGGGGPTRARTEEKGARKRAYVSACVGTRMSER
jgi:hypothetical protein